MTHHIRSIPLIAGLILAAMFVLMLTSILNEPPIIDEVPHIAAGLGYVTQLDFRLNPEHPPLIKVLGALFAHVFAQPRFPIESRFWQTDINGQWDQGAHLLYDVGNNPDAIMLWARIPVILLTCLLGWLLYDWTRKRFGTTTGTISLLLYAFSPTMLAHGRYLTTDLGAAFGFFIGITAFLAFLERPDMRRIAWGGTALGIALLFKFSTFLLLPFCFGLLVLWALAAPSYNIKEQFMLFVRLLGKTMVLGIIAMAVVWSVYGLFVWNYPQERQLHDATYLLGSYGFRPAVNLDIMLIKNPLTRPLGEYLLGLLMVQQRAAGGNTAYFLGEVSNSGSRLYFPFLYLVKETLPLHILTLIALVWGIKKFGKWRARERGRKTILAIRESLYRHFPEWAAAAFIVFYWFVSIKSPLNIGIRHIIPTLPFMYILVARGVSSWLKGKINPQPDNFMDVLRNLYHIFLSSLPKYMFLIILFGWMIVGTLTTAPHFLASYNELGGGLPNGWKIAVDSNYDWGQDLKRLADFVQENNIDKIKLDYFGWARPGYYLKDHYEHWSSSRGRATGWYAISATYRQGSFGTPIYDFMRKPEDNLDWLKPYPPIARAGYSIFIYKLPE
ncbi:MAG: glycosyltransferase family 39 protein [Candidatus Sungbacteria bacterium]|nr:glycosyltransferase family 39 protein [bacterium]MDZ4260140.1 glycosyltransferase family 39 protein [Candidatus Sungbacteria bacterium]